MKEEETIADELSEQDPKVKRVVVMATTTSVPDGALVDRIRHFSDWFCAKKSVALCIRYIRILKGRLEERKGSSCSERAPHRSRRDKDTDYPLLTVEELQQAATVNNQVYPSCRL